MQEIKYFPMGRVKLTPMQKKEMAIKRLKHWVVLLAVTDVMYTILVVAILYGRIFE